MFPWYTLPPQNPRASEVHHTVLNARLVEENCKNSNQSENIVFHYVKIKAPAVGIYNKCWVSFKKKIKIYFGYSTALFSTAKRIKQLHGGETLDDL